MPQEVALGRLEQAAHDISRMSARPHVRQGPLKRREAISQACTPPGPVMPPESPCDDHTTPASPHRQGHASAAQQARVQAVGRFGQRLLQPDAGQSDPWGVVDRTLRRRGAEPAVPGRQCRLDRGQAGERARGHAHQPDDRLPRREPRVPSSSDALRADRRGLAGQSELPPADCRGPTWRCSKA